MKFLICLIRGHDEPVDVAVSLGARGRYYRYSLCRRCGHEVIRWL